MSEGVRGHVSCLLLWRRTDEKCKDDSELNEIEKLQRLAGARAEQ